MKGCWEGDARNRARQKLKDQKSASCVPFLPIRIRYSERILRQQIFVGVVIVQGLSRFSVASWVFARQNWFSPMLTILGLARD